MFHNETVERFGPLGLLVGIQGVGQVEVEGDQLIEQGVAMRGVGQTQFAQVVGSRARSAIAIALPVSPAFRYSKNSSW